MTMSGRKLALFPSLLAIAYAFGLPISHQRVLFELKQKQLSPLIEANDPISTLVEPERCALGNKGQIFRGKNQLTRGHLPEANPGIKPHIPGVEVGPYHLLSHASYEAQEHLAISRDCNWVSYTSPLSAYCPNCVSGFGIKYPQCRPEESARHAARGSYQVIPWPISVHSSFVSNFAASCPEGTS
jgi:hypothetical protein